MGEGMSQVSLVGWACNAVDEQVLPPRELGITMCRCASKSHLALCGQLSSSVHLLETHLPEPKHKSCAT